MSRTQVRMILRYPDLKIESLIKKLNAQNMKILRESNFMIPQLQIVAANKENKKEKKVIFLVLNPQDVHGSDTQEQLEQGVDANHDFGKNNKRAGYEHMTQEQLLNHFFKAAREFLGVVLDSAQYPPQEASSDQYNPGMFSGRGGGTPAQPLQLATFNAIY